jgi:hypothetical protein
MYSKADRRIALCGGAGRSGINTVQTNPPYQGMNGVTCVAEVPRFK